MRAKELIRKLQEIIETYHGDPEILVETGSTIKRNGDRIKIIVKQMTFIEFKRGDEYTAENDYIIMRKSK